MDRRNLIKTLSAGGLAAGVLATGGSSAMATAMGGTERTANKLLDLLMKAINTQDLSLFDHIYAADGYVNHQVLVMNAAPAQKMGRDQAKNYFAARFKAFPDINLNTDIRVARGDMIAANLVWSGTQKDAYLGVPATGKHVAWNSTDILRVREGYFVEHWGAVDFFGLMKQLQS